MEVRPPPSPEVGRTRLDARPHPEYRISGMRNVRARPDTSSVPPHQGAHRIMSLATAQTSKRRLSSEDTLALWKEYRRTDDRAVRDRLVLTFAPLVKYIVYKKEREMPARCEVEDFISCGLEALIQSIERYDPAKGATLEQYAWTRIHGAVLDELRRQDWAPRSVRPGRAPAPRPPLGARHRARGRRVHHAARPPAQARRARRLHGHHRR